MKKHVSVWMLLNRFTFWKLFLVLVIMCAAQIILFQRVLIRELHYAELDLSFVALEAILEKSRIGWALAGGFIAYTAVLSGGGCAFGSMSGYTLRRLSVSEKTVFVWQSVHNALSYMLFWASQVGISLLLCFWFENTAETHITGQTVFLAYYRSDLFHALLPLDDIIIWIRNFLVCIGLGIAAAAFPYRQREGKFGSEIVVLVCLSLVWFVSGLGNYQLDVLLLSGFIITAMEAIYHVFSTEEDVL